MSLGPVQAISGVFFSGTVAVHPTPGGSMQGTARCVVPGAEPACTPESGDHGQAERRAHPAGSRFTVPVGRGKQKRHSEE